MGMRMRKLQTMKKTMGRTMFTLIGLSRSGCFHLSSSKNCNKREFGLPEVEETANGKCDEEGFHKRGEVYQNVNI